MSKSKKTYVLKISSFIVNLIEGAIAILAMAVIYSFVFEENNKDHDIGLGFFVLFIWFIVLFMPNIIFKFIVKLNKKDMVIFQVLPFLLGAISYLAFQLVVR